MPSTAAQDCLEMSPLHMLFWHAQQNRTLICISLSLLITTNQLKSLITDDGLPSNPLYNLNLIWGNALEEIVQFFVNSQKSTMPNLIMNGDMMVETLCRAKAIPRDFQEVAWYSAKNLLWSCWQLAKSRPRINYVARCARRCFARCDSIRDVSSNLSMAKPFSTSQPELIQNLLEIQLKFFSTSWQYEKSQPKLIQNLLDIQLKFFNTSWQYENNSSSR